MPIQCDPGCYEDGQPLYRSQFKSINRHPELFVDNPAMVIKPHISSDDSPYLYASVPIKNGGWVIAYIDPYTFGAELSKLTIGQNLDLASSTLTAPMSTPAI